MKYGYVVLPVLLALLSLAAGTAKVLQAPQEVQFFVEAGLGTALLIPFGVLQIAAAGLTIYSPTRRTGAGLMTIGFLVSAVAIFLTGNLTFALVSLVPVALAMVLVRRPITPA